LFLLLVLIPFLSWLFLDYGLDFRKKSFDEMSLNELLADTLFQDYGIQLKDKITFVDLDGSDEVVKGVYEQFKKAPNFQLLTTKRFIGVDENIENVFLIGGDTIRAILSKDVLNGHQYSLIDGDAQMRNVYKDDSEKGNMVKHIATLLPFVDKNTRRRDGK
jgi:hypothetical protein